MLKISNGTRLCAELSSAVCFRKASKRLQALMCPLALHISQHTIRPTTQCKVPSATVSPDGACCRCSARLSERTLVVALLALEGMDVGPLVGLHLLLLLQQLRSSPARTQALAPLAICGKLMVEAEYLSGLQVCILLAYWPGWDKSTDPSRHYF